MQDIITTNNEQLTEIINDLFTSYDTPEQIQKCLHCEKSECTNCLRWINGV